VEWLAEPMSEFKFACPVCGQHITSDSSASGTQLECPTCFQKIVVPQAPESGDAKFILSASQAAKPRPTNVEASSGLGPLKAQPARSPIPGIALLAVLLCAAAAAAWVWRDKIRKPTDKPAPMPTNVAPKPVVKAMPPVFHPIPTNLSWTSTLTNATIPEAPAVGSIHGHGFLLERATLQGGTLSLRQGKGWPPDLGLTVMLHAQQGEDLNGKTVEISPERTPPTPKVLLRWKDDQGQASTENIPSGYALKVVFGQATNGHMPGKIYICLPDEAKSFAAGTFDAEIRRPSPPKQHPPKQPKPPGQ
jgi:hypothetical protein